MGKLLRRRQIKPMGAERGSRKVGKAKRMKSSRHAVHSSYGRGIKSGASLRKYTLKAMTDVRKVFDAVLLTSLERRQMSLSLAVHAKDCSRSPLSIGE